MQIKMFEPLVRLAKVLIAPAETISGNEPREQSRVLAIVNLSIIVTGSVAAGIEYFAFPQFLNALYVVIAGSGGLAISYLVNRSGYYVVAAWVTVSVGVAVSFAFMFIHPVSATGVSMLVITTIGAGILLSSRHTYIVVGSAIVVLALLIGLTPLKAQLVSYATSIWIVLAGGFLVLIGLHNRDRIAANAQRELRQSETDLSTILQNLQDTYYRTDPRGKIIHISGSITELLGYQPEELIGEPIVSLNADAGGQETFLTELESSDGKIGNYEVRLKHKNGEIVWASLNSQYVRDDDDRLVAIEGTMRDVSEKRVAEGLRSRFGRLLDQSHHEIYVFDSRSLLFTQVNYGALNNLGYSIEEIQQKTPYDIKPEYSKETFIEFLQPLYRGEQDALIFETVHRRKDRTDYNVEIRLQLYTNEQPPVFIAMAQDITERRQAESRARTLSMALQQAADTVIVTDTMGIIEYVNPAFEETTGYSREEVTGKTPAIVRSGKHDRDFYRNMWEIISSGEVYRDVFINRRKDGDIYYEEMTVTPIKDTSGKIVNYISTGKDISERIESQERLHYLAHHDVLTDLPNRMLFLERLSHALTHAQRSDKTCAVLFLDLDRFKKINDTMGHDIGDRLLQTVGERLKNVVRDGDTIARLGGDEFTVLLEGITSPEDVGSISRKILKELSRPFSINHQQLYTSTSIGISLFPTDGTDANTLLKNADAAMYRAKDYGRNNYQFYSADLGAKALEHFTLEAGLRNALKREEFVLYFQPQLEIQSGDFVGVEALIRWNHPELGLVSPAEFIPLLEDTGLIVPAGKWILETACKQVKAWQDAGIEVGRLAVNISSRQLEDPNFVLTVEGVLKEIGFDPAKLELEITESLLMSHAVQTVQAIRMLNSKGVRLAIDDFGTGYSSLSYLKRFPIDTLKIDQSFVRDITTDMEDAAIVKAILAMSHSLGIEVVAEGVETREQESFLQAHGCDFVQGYLYARPAPSVEIEALFSGDQQATV